MLSGITAALLGMGLLAGCGQQGGEQETPEPITTADMSGVGPGTLVSAETIPRLSSKLTSTGALAARVVYRSTSGITGGPTQVSAVVLVPPGQPPAGGWPVIAFAHGTTGILPGCAPSRSKDVWGTAPMLANYITGGYAVAATDYEGLGEPGHHPYLNAKTAGFNVIDSVRAARKVSSKVSTRWAAFGGSQGGSATWAANEFASTYGTELNLVGSISLSPPPDISELAQKAAHGTLTKDQQAAYIWLLIGLEQSHPGFSVDEYRHGKAKDNWTVLGACMGPEGEKRNKLLADLSADDLKPSSPQAVTALTQILDEMALPQQKAAAPMLVIYGGEDSFIDFEWTRDAIQRACRMGSVIEAVFQPDKGHEVDGSSYSAWIPQRFQGAPAKDTCDGR